MEHQTRFDLNAAVENWRNELSAQAALSTDDRRELETHLRDAFAELKARGLSDEESFVLARHRVGQPQKLADEFVKENPAKIWRERLFWVVFCFFVIRLWSSLTSSILYAFYTNLNFTIHSRLEDILPQWVLFYFPNWLRDLHYVQFMPGLFGIINLLLTAVIVLFIVRGKMEKIGSIWAFAFASRSRFALLAMLLVVFDYVAGNQLYNLLGDKKSGIAYTANFSFNALWLLGLVAIATWLVPSQNSKRPKHA
jgi:hypothetical protein